MYRNHYCNNYPEPLEGRQFSGKIMDYIVTKEKIQEYLEQRLMRQMILLIFYKFFSLSSFVAR